MKREGERVKEEERQNDRGSFTNSIACGRDLPDVERIFTLTSVFRVPEVGGVAKWSAAPGKKRS